MRKYHCQSCRQTMIMTDSEIAAGRCGACRRVGLLVPVEVDDPSDASPAGGAVRSDPPNHARTGVPPHPPAGGPGATSTALPLHSFIPYVRPSTANSGTPASSASNAPPLARTGEPLSSLAPVPAAEAQHYARLSTSKGGEAWAVACLWVAIALWPCGMFVRAAPLDPFNGSGRSLTPEQRHEAVRQAVIDRMGGIVVMTTPFALFALVAGWVAARRMGRVSGRVWVGTILAGAHLALMAVNLWFFVSDLKYM